MGIATLCFMCVRVDNGNTDIIIIVKISFFRFSGFPILYDNTNIVLEAILCSKLLVNFVCIKYVLVYSWYSTYQHVETFI